MNDKTITAAECPSLFEDNTKGVIIVSRSMGVYIGGFLGLGFWSKIDAAGQPSAAAFLNEQWAKEYIASWETQPPDDLSFPEVNIDDPAYWASMQECVKVGVEPWEL